MDALKNGSAPAAAGAPGIPAAVTSLRARLAISRIDRPSSKSAILSESQPSKGMTM
jgi:hypothetical protein